MSQAWDPAAPGILKLPSGRLVRGRGLRQPLPAGDSASLALLPEFGLYLLGSEPPDVAWESRWLRWPDFGLPADRAQTARMLAEAWRRSDGERVEIACAGGRGRTGTALACLAVFDGVPASEAVGFVRANYDPRAVETPWQRRFVARFRPASGAAPR
jgi:Swiss Army Knife protein, DSP-PTPase phosphatase domain